MILALTRLIFLIQIVMLPLVRGFEIKVEGYPLLLIDALFPLCAVLWLAAVANKEIALKKDPFFLLLLAYWSVLLLSAVFSVDRSASFTKLLGETYLFGLCFIGFQLFSFEDFRPWVVKAWLVGTGFAVLGTAVGVALFYLGDVTQTDNGFLSHFGSLPAGNYPRVRSTFANANMMANYMNISVMMLGIAVSAGWIKGVFKKIFEVGVWTAAFFTLSPGLGGLALSWSLWTRRSLFAKGKKAAAGVIVAAGVLTAVLFFGATLVSPDTPNTDQNVTLFGRTFEPSVRVLVWESAIRTVADHPILGRGVGIDPASVHYETISGDRQYLRDAHNIALNVAGQSGLLGLAVFTMMVFYLVRMIRDHAGSNDTFYALALAFIGAFLYQGLTGSFEDARHVWLLIGFLIAAKQ